MSIAETAETAAPPHVEAVIKYPERAADGGRIWGNQDFDFALEDHRMRIGNARLETPSFETRGFTLLRRTTDIDLTDPQDVERGWHPQACSLVRQLTGAAEVFTLLGILRGGEEEAGGGPAFMAHVDFDSATLRSWVRRLGGERGEELSRRRLVNINLWTPVRPVENMPLAVCDAGSVVPGDFLRVSFGKPETRESDAFAGGFDSGGFVVAYNPDHRWFYYPDMQPHEVLAFRLHDTSDPSLKMTAHTAFEDQTSRPGSPKRTSYEIRTIAVFD